MSAGNSSVSSISTISTSPDWISAAPSHEIIIGIQSPPPEQFSGVCNENKKKKKKREKNTMKNNKLFCIINLYFLVFIWWFDLFDTSMSIRPKKKTKMQKTSTTNNSSRSHSRSRSSYGINVGFINFLICKFLMLIARTAWKFIVRWCGWLRVSCMCCVLKNDNNMHMETDVCSCKPLFLSLSFSSATKKIVSHTHTTEKSA